MFDNFSKHKIWINMMMEIKRVSLFSVDYFILRAIRSDRLDQGARFSRNNHYLFCFLT